MITGLFTGLFLALIFIAWKYANVVKVKILLKLSGKTEIDNMDLDNLLRFVIFIVLFLIGAIPLTLVIINTTE